MFDILLLAIGYIIGVVVPVPGLSSKILSAWKTLGTKIKTLISKK